MCVCSCRLASDRGGAGEQERDCANREKVGGRLGASSKRKSLPFHFPARRRRRRSMTITAVVMSRQTAAAFHQIIGRHPQLGRSFACGRGGGPAEGDCLAAPTSSLLFQLFGDGVRCHAISNLGGIPLSFTSIPSSGDPVVVVVGGIYCIPLTFLPPFLSSCGETRSSSFLPPSSSPPPSPSSVGGIGDDCFLRIIIEFLFRRARHGQSPPYPQAHIVQMRSFLRGPKITEIQNSSFLALSSPIGFIINEGGVQSQNCALRAWGYRGL